MISINTKFDSSLKTVFAVLIFLKCFALTQVYAGSYSISPMILTLEPDQHNTQQWLTVKSNSNEAIAVELSVVKREVDILGNILNKSNESDDNFLIYPSQIILFPGDVQMVNIQWLGDLTPTKELIFNLVAEQVPINLDEEENSKKNTGKLEMALLLKYQGIVYVRPHGVKPNVIVESAIPEINKNGIPHLIVMLNNKGSARQKINKLKLTVTPLDENGNLLDEKSIVYMPEMPKGLIKQSLYAEDRRRCELQWPEGVPVGPVKVSVVCK